MGNVLKNFITRAVTGIIFVLVVAAMFVLGAKTHAITYAVMMVVIISIATHEYYRMLQAGGMSPHFRTALCTNLAAFILGFMACNYGMDTRFILSVVGLVPT